MEIFTLDLADLQPKTYGTDPNEINLKDYSI